MVTLNAIKSASAVNLKVKRAKVIRQERVSAFSPILGAELKVLPDFVYYKGDDGLVRDGLARNGTEIASTVQHVDLAYSRDETSFRNIALGLMYSSLRVNLQKKGYSVVSKLSDSPTGISRHVTTKLVLPVAAGESPFLCQSVRLFLDPREDDYLYFCLDLQSHMAAPDASNLAGRNSFEVNRRKYRILTRQERQDLGLLEQFQNASKVTVSTHLDRLNTLLKDLPTSATTQVSPSINFSDQDQVRFHPQFRDLSAVEQQEVTSDSFTILNFPTVKFAQGSYTSPFTGLLNDAPYKLRSERNAKILILCNKADRSYVDAFLSRLKDSTGRWRGFLKTFGVYLDYSIEQYDAENPDDLVKEVEAKTRLASEEVDLVLVVAKDEYVDQAYYDLKRTIWKFGFISQLVEIDNAVKKIVAGDLYTLINLATGIFVKLNGIPWIVEREELQNVLGYIGLSFTKKPIGANINYGVAYIFDRRGFTVDVAIQNYSLSSLPPPERDVPQDTSVSGLFLPKDKMIGVLESAVEKLRSLSNMDVSQRASLVVHKSARIHAEEMSAAAETARSRNVDIYLVHTKLSSPYNAFDKISLVDSAPLRGSYYHIDANRGVLWTAGSRREKGEPMLRHPLEVNLASVARASGGGSGSNVDSLKISAQIYNLTMMNWRSGNIKSLPVTINYAQEAARLMTNGIELSAKNWYLVI